MKKYASIIVQKYNVKPYNSLTYQYESDIKLHVGMLVKIPFRTGYCLGIVENINDSKPTTTKQISYKSIDSIIHEDFIHEDYVSFMRWLGEYYAASPAAVWRAMLPAGLHVRKSRTALSAIDNTTQHIPHTLTNKQIEIVQKITTTPGKYLLHGVTGAGKTEIYTHIAQHIIQMGKSVIILVPEISLTPQTIAYFQNRFACPVIATHSRMSAAQRRAVWLHAAHSTEPSIYIGPRSTLFLPINQLGLIVIDEEHETSYKQESQPTYHAVAVAAWLATQSNATLILGSATPSVSSYYLAERGKLELMELDSRISSHTTNVAIIKLDKGAGLLSSELISALKSVLKKRQQAVLFLNRRGSAHAQLCTNCGFHAVCQICETNLAFHENVSRLVCHNCGYQRLPFTLCPSCGENELIFVGMGTQKLVTEISTRLPEARVARLDRDIVSDDDFFQTLEKFSNHEIDILIGTQMIAKGLDIEHVTLAAVMLADGMMYLPNFDTAERTFSLINQVIGRSGRRDSAGEAIIQTYSPENPLIALAAQGNYKKFYEEEIHNLRQYGYPPFRYLLTLQVTHKSSTKARATLTAIHHKIQHTYPNLTILGPSQPQFSKTPRGYIWQIVIKSSHRSILVDIATTYGREATINLDPITIT